MTMSSQILCFATYLVGIVNSRHGWGHLSAYVSSEDRRIAFKCLFIQQLFWVLATALMRISVASSLLPLSTRTAWKWALWAIIAVQTLTYIGHMVFAFGNCRPVSGAWDRVPSSRCWDRKYLYAYGWVSNSMTHSSLPLRWLTVSRHCRRDRLYPCSHASSADSDSKSIQA